MSQEELVHAYLRGSISRRTFIRRLVATGITLSAAITYAHALRPALAQAEHVPDHYEAPSVITLDAGEFGADSAHLRADVDPNQLQTTVFFEFGTTASYGIKTPNQTISGNGPQPVGAAVVGLDPGRTYHFRVVASNQIDQATGADKTFAIPDSTQPQTSISAVDTELGSVLDSGVFRVLVSSNEAVTVALEATMRKKKRKGAGGSSARAAKQIVAASGNLSLDEGGDRVAELALTQAGKRALKKLERAKLNVRAEARDLAGNVAVSEQSIRIS